MKAILATVGGVVALVASLITAEIVTTESSFAEGTVLSKSFTPAATGVGTGVGANGQVVTTVTHVSEKWILVVQLDENPTLYTVEVEKLQWACLEEGDQLTFTVYTSCFGVSDPKLPAGGIR